jgi:hypothetical protein
MLAASTIALVVAMSAVPTIPAGALTRSQLKSKTLSLSNMPTGWTASSTSPSGSTSSTSTLTSACLKGVSRAPKDQTVAKVLYRDGRIPLFGEELGWGRGALAGYERLNHILATCKHVSGSTEGQKYSFTVGALTFPKLGNTTGAYRMTLAAAGIHVTTDFVLLRVGPVEATIVYRGAVQPQPNQLQGFVSEATDKIEGKPVPAPQPPA